MAVEEKSIFVAAMALADASQRAAYLQEACAGHPELLGRLHELLCAHDEAQGPLDRRPAALGVAAVAPSFCDGPGTVIGPYRLLEQIGEGGFGVVFMAEQQQPMRRQVAVKVLKPGMDTRQVIARFQVERQALALMDHPNVARILDGGETASGRPYFVMELVRGIPITDFCDQHELPVRARLELFLDVCQAVQHAHQKGIIHRDLKPSNVMVTLHDDRAVVKVIDFGIAKATGQQLTDRTLFTGFTQLIGTPMYMSPEQAQLSGLDVDTRSDIYALGVLLYELLTGTTPFDKERLRLVGYDEIRRIIREEEPPRPSTRLHKDEGGRMKDETRRTKQTRWDRFLPFPSFILRPSSFAELDWIVMKCLEKDRDRRYDTANGLALDVQRYLRDEQVQACPPSATYRLKKFLRRNRRPLLVAALVLLALVGGAVASIWQALRATQAQTLAQERAEAAEANLVLARQAVDEMYTQVARELSNQTQMLPYQRHVLEKALRFYQEFARRKSGDPAIRLDTAGATLRVGMILHSLGHHRQAKQPCEEAIAALEGLAAELAAEPLRREWLGGAFELRGSLLARSGRRQQAETSLRHALTLYAELAAELPDHPEYKCNLARVYVSVGSVLDDRPAEAENAHREAVKLCEELVAGPGDPVRYRMQLAQSYLSLGTFLATVGQYAAAEKALHQVIDLADRWAAPSDRTHWVWTRSSAEFEIGKILAADGRREAAEKAYRHAIGDVQQLAALFADMPVFRQYVAKYSGSLAALLAAGGKLDEAAQLRRSARELFERLEAEVTDEQELHDHLLEAGHTLREADDLQSAERYLRKALTLADKRAAEDPAEPVSRARVAGGHAHLGTVLQRQERAREAAEQFRQALAIYQRLAADFADESLYRHQQASVLNFLGIALRSLPGERLAAEGYHKQAIGLCVRLVAGFPDQPEYQGQLIRSHFALGVVLRLAGRPAEAVQAFEQAIAAYRPDLCRYAAPESRLQFAAVHNELAWLLATHPDDKYRDSKRAVVSARKAVETDPANGGFCNTLGVALYRVGEWAEAREVLTKSMALRGGGDPYDWYFLAMAHRQLGDQNEARVWYDKALAWGQKNRENEELRRFRIEAAALLGVKDR
jgi:serine/threonine protein kinase